MSSCSAARRPAWTGWPKCCWRRPRSMGMSIQTATGASAAPRTFDPLAFKDDLAAFRAEVRAWLEAVVPADWRERMTGAAETHYVAFQCWWFAEMGKVGLATPHWPRDWGGADIGIRH